MQNARGGISGVWHTRPFQSISPKCGAGMARNDSPPLGIGSSSPTRLTAAKKIHNLSVPIGVHTVEEWHLQPPVGANKFRKMPGPHHVPILAHHVWGVHPGHTQCQRPVSSLSYDRSMN